MGRLFIIFGFVLLSVLVWVGVTALVSGCV